MRFNQFIKPAIILMIALLLFLNCQPTQQDSTKIREAIVTANGNFMEAFNKGDAAGVAALYTAEGQLLPGNSDFVTGTQAIQDFWQAVMDQGKYIVIWKQVEGEWKLHRDIWNTSMPVQKKEAEE